MTLITRIAYVHIRDALTYERNKKGFVFFERRSLSTTAYARRSPSPRNGDVGDETIVEYGRGIASPFERRNGREANAIARPLASAHLPNAHVELERVRSTLRAESQARISRRMRQYASLQRNGNPTRFRKRRSQNRPLGLDGE